MILKVTATGPAPSEEFKTFKCLASLKNLVVQGAGNSWKPTLPVESLVMEATTDTVPNWHLANRLGISTTTNWSEGGHLV